MESPLIFNIQRFSVHDGPGIRTTFFFKGCPLRCRWCHNPESQSPEPESMKQTDGTLKTAGRAYTIDQLAAEAEKDRIFYEQSNGGITLSGGEPLMGDSGFAAGFLERCKARGLSTAVDTCGFVSYERFRRVLPFTDLFLYDLKFLDPGLHLRYTGQSNGLILENLIRLGRGGAAVNLRLPLLGGINDSVEQMAAVRDWLRENAVSIQSVNLLPYHVYGREKYAELGREWEAFSATSPAHFEQLKQLWSAAGYRTGIGGASAGEEIDS